MPFYNFKRHGIFAVSIVVFGLTTPSSFASPASELIDNYNAWYLENGLEEASYAEVIETGDTTEIRDYKISGVFTSENDDGKPAYTFYVYVNLPKLIFKNSDKSGNVYSYQSLDIESATYEFGVIKSHEAFSSLEAAKAADPIGVFSGQLKDYSTKNYSEEWSANTDLKEKNDKDAFLHLLGLTTSMSFGETTIGELIFDGNIMTQRGHNILRGYKSSGSKNGKTALIAIESYTGTTENTYSNWVFPTGRVEKAVETHKNVKIIDFDIRPLLAFFQLSESPSSRVLKSYSDEEVNMEMSGEGADANEPNGKMVVNIASTSVQDLSISGGDGLELISIINNLDVKDTDPGGETFFELLDALGSYSIGYSDMKDLAVKVWDPVRAKREAEVAPSFEMTLASASMSDFNSNSLGSVKLEGLHGAIEGDDAVFDIGSFEIADVAWPSLKTMIEKGMMAEHDPNAVLEIIPTIGKLSITGFEAITGDLNTPVSLSELTLLMENHVGPIPTKVTEVIGDLEFDALLLEEPMVLSVFERLGIERVAINENFNIAWDEETEDLTLEKFEFELKNGLKLRADIQLGGISRSLFTDPDRAEAVIALATFKGWAGNCIIPVI